MTIRDGTLADAAFIRARWSAFRPQFTDKAGIIDPTLAYIQQVINVYGWRAVVDDVSPFGILVYHPDTQGGQIITWAASIGGAASFRAMFRFLGAKGVTAAWPLLWGMVWSTEAAVSYLNARCVADHMAPASAEIFAAGFATLDGLTPAQLLAIPHYIRYSITPAQAVAVG